MDLISYIFLGLLVIATIVYLVIRHEKNRMRALQVNAQMRGFSYEKKGELDRLGEAVEFYLFHVGYGKRIQNLMERSDRDIQACIYDYQYTAGAGKSSHTRKQTVFQFHTELLKLPAFTLRPENVFHKIGRFFGYRDIVFENSPGFSDKYLLRGEDEAAIRKLFNQEVIALFESGERLAVEGKGPFLIFYRPSKRVHPDQVWATYENMHMLCRVFVRQSEAS